MKLADLRLAPAAGLGLVARWDGFVVAAVGGDAGMRAELVDLVRTSAAEPAEARTFAHRLAALVTASDPIRLPSFVALADGDGGVAVLLRGDATLRATAGDEVTTMSGADRPTWVDDYLREEYESIVITVGGTEGATDEGWDLEAGVVGGGGAVLVPRSAAPVAEAPKPAEDAEPEPVADAEPEPEPADDAELEPVAEAEPEPAEDAELAPVAEAESEPAAEADPVAAGEESPAPEEPVAAEAEPVRAFVAVDLTTTAGIEERKPLPVAEDATQDKVPVGTAPKPVEAPAGVLVRGLRCIRGHFNHPRARFCALCGISMVQQTQVLVDGERPPLGILVFSDGKTVGLATSYLLGRDPGIDAAVGAGELLPLQLDDPDQILSRVHCEVRLVEWDVQLVDRNSANGTFVREGGAEEWQRLASGDPTTLAPGMEARVGSHRFVYESHHQQS